MVEINLNKIRFVTVYTGTNGPAHCVCRCPCCSQKAVDSSTYQGNIKQAVELFERLPNLEQVYILGNPDPACDTEYCNALAREAVERGVKVCFSTSGVGGKQMAERLLSGVPQNMTDYVSFSIDSVVPEKMNMLKGINYPFEKAVEGIKWCLYKQYPVKIQPTLWNSSNYMEAGNIIRYFHKIGVTWYSFHMGSVESGIDLPTHKHLTPEQIQKVHDLINEAVMGTNIKVRCPVIFAGCGNNDPSKWYCMYPERCKELLVYLGAEGIKATHTPMASCFCNQTVFSLNDARPMVRKFNMANVCPFAEQLVGNCRNTPICRYVSKVWNAF